MLAFLMSLLGIVPAALSTVNGITNAISNEKIAALGAKTDQERIASEERISALNAQRDAMLAELQKSKWPIWIQSSIGAAISVIVWKLFVYDKALGQWTGGHTDSLDPNLWNVFMVVIGFYFLSTVFRK